MRFEKGLEFLRRENLQAEMGKTCLSLGTAYASRNQEGDRGLLAARGDFPSD